MPLQAGIVSGLQQGFTLLDRQRHPKLQILCRRKQWLIGYQYLHVSSTVPTAHALGMHTQHILTLTTFRTEFPFVTPMGSNEMFSFKCVPESGSTETVSRSIAAQRRIQVWHMPLEGRKISQAAQGWCRHSFKQEAVPCCKDRTAPSWAL